MSTRQDSNEALPQPFGRPRWPITPPSPSRDLGNASASATTVLSADVAALGRALLARTAEGVARTVAPNTGSGASLGETAEQRFRRVREISTRALAGWSAGESLQ